MAVEWPSQIMVAVFRKVGLGYQSPPINPTGCRHPFLSSEILEFAKVHNLKLPSVELNDPLFSQAI